MSADLHQMGTEFGSKLRALAQGSSSNRAEAIAQLVAEYTTKFQQAAGSSGSSGRSSSRSSRGSRRSD